MRAISATVSLTATSFRDIEVFIRSNTCCPYNPSQKPLLPKLRVAGSKTPFRSYPRSRRIWLALFPGPSVRQWLWREFHLKCVSNPYKKAPFQRRKQNTSFAVIVLRMSAGALSSTPAIQRSLVGLESSFRRNLSIGDISSNQATFFHGHVPVASDDDVIQNVNPDDMARFNQAPGDLNVFGARGGIAAWMIVNANDGRAAS